MLKKRRCTYTVAKRDRFELVGWRPNGSGWFCSFFVIILGNCIYGLCVSATDVVLCIDKDLLLVIVFDMHEDHDRENLMHAFKILLEKKNICSSVINLENNMFVCSLCDRSWRRL